MAISSSLGPPAPAERRVMPIAPHRLPRLRLPGAPRAPRRAAGPRPALSSGSLPLPHLGDCTHDGQPVVALAGGDRLAGRGQPVARPPRSRARRSRRRPGARRRRRRSAARCRGAARSRPRRCPSGRRWRTAAAGRSRRARRRARRPGTSAGVEPGRAEPLVGDGPPDRPGAQRAAAGRSSGSSPSTSPVTMPPPQEATRPGW